MTDQKNIYPADVSSCKGFTLVEVLVALTILVIGLLGVAMMQIATISGNTFSREMAVATELGQDLLEKLNSATYTSLITDPKLTPGPHTNAEIVDANNNAQANPIDAKGMSTDLSNTALPAGTTLYTRTWTVTDPAAGATFGVGTDIKTVTVTVTWTDSAGTINTVAIDRAKVRG